MLLARPSRSGRTEFVGVVQGYQRQTKSTRRESETPTDLDACRLIGHEGGDIE
jgi:hypothetical protein